MVHSASFIAAAAKTVDASAAATGVSAVVAVVLVLLGVAAMFGLLFWTKWVTPGGDPTGVVERERRERLNQNPAYSS